MTIHVRLVRRVRRPRDKRSESGHQGIPASRVLTDSAAMSDDLGDDIQVQLVVEGLDLLIQRDWQENAACAQVEAVRQAVLAGSNDGRQDGPATS